MNFLGNKIKLSFTRPKFTKNGNKITCQLKYRIVVPSVNSCSSHKSLGNDSAVVTDFGCGVYNNSVNIPSDFFVATGVAVCNEGDTFDNNLGRKMAEARAESAAYSHAAPIVKKYVQSLAEDLLNMSYDFAAKSDGVRRHNKEYVNDLING